MPKKRISHILLIILCAVLVIVPGCSEVSQEYPEIVTPAMLPAATVIPTLAPNVGEDCYSLLVNGKMLTLAFSEPIPEDIAAKIFSDYTALSTELNTADETGAFFAFNNSDATSLPLTTLQADFINEGIRAGQLTEGAFDITDESLRALWDFSGELFTPPTEEEISEALTQIDYQRIVIEDNTLLTENAAIQLNTSNYFDSYAVKQALNTLAENGITSAELTFGNLTYYLGSSADGLPCELMLTAPMGEASIDVGSVVIKDMAFTALHCMDQYQETEAGLLHPLFDLHTGYPSKLGFTSVFVFSGSPVLAQTMARACYSLTVEQGKTLVSNLEDTHILWIMNDGSFQFSDGFSDRMSFIPTR